MAMISPRNTMHPNKQIPAPSHNGGDRPLLAITPPEIQALLDLSSDPTKKEFMLTGLVNMAPSYGQLGLLLGESQTFMKVLIEELSSVSVLPPSTWTPHQADQLACALQLLSVIVLSYPSPGMSFPIRHFLQYLLPLVSTDCKEGPIELVLVRTLQVFDAMIMVPDDGANRLSFWPPVALRCLDVMQNGSLKSKISATTLLQHILWFGVPLDLTGPGSQLDSGSVLFNDVVSVLEKMFTFPSYDLVKLSFYFCLLLPKYGRACHALVRRLPYMVKNGYLLYFLVKRPEGQFHEGNFDVLVKKVHRFYSCMSTAEREELREMAAKVAADMALKHGKRA